MRSRCCSGLGRPSGDAGMSGRRVTSKAPSLAHVVGGSGRSEASPTAILKDTHSVEGEFSEGRMDRDGSCGPWATPTLGVILPLSLAEAWGSPLPREKRGERWQDGCSIYR
jgi:hypothetical protein